MRRHRWGGIAVVAGAFVVACSAGGAGTLVSDGGVDSSVHQSGLEVDASTSTTDADHSTKLGPADCNSLCTEAAQKRPESCEWQPCVSQCDEDAQRAAQAKCVTQHAALMTCIARHIDDAACTSDGRLPTSGCASESSALASCLTAASKNKPGTCPQQCTTDLQCQQTCPSAGTGHTSCCDLTSGICFASSTPSCPTTTEDAGVPPSY